MNMRRSALLTVTLLATLGLMTACASDADPTNPDPVSQPENAATLAPVTPSEPPWQPLKGKLERCDPQPATVQEAQFHVTTLHDPRVGTTPAVLLGTAKNVLILLHQTDGGGLCGWLPFMPAAAAAGYTTMAIDLCRYGEAHCRKVDDGTFTDADQTDPVIMAVRYARDELRAKHVIVMGASMGGAVALMSGTVIPHLTAVVDLSGPMDWPGSRVARGGRALKVPALVAMADTESDFSIDGARALAQQAPGGSRFLGPEGEHGWNLVTDPEGVATGFATHLFEWLVTQTG